MSDNILPFNQKVPQPRFSIEDATEVKCASCGCATFSNVFIIKRLSRLQTGDEKDTLYTIPVFACSKCGLALEETLPKRV